MEIDENSKDIIMRKLGQIKANSDIESIELDFETKNVNFDAIDLKNAKELKNIWQDIAKLSLGGYNDFIFFQQLHIMDIHNSPIYNTAMDNIGYKKHNNLWKLMKQPDEDIVVENIYKFCFYTYIVQSKTQIPNKIVSKKKPAEFPISKEPKLTNPFSAIGSFFLRKAVAESVQVVDKWTCRVCECNNVYEVLCCVACNEVGPHANKWRCSKCTFLNEKGAFSCDVCGSVNETVLSSNRLDTMNAKRY